MTSMPTVRVAGVDDARELARLRWEQHVEDMEPRVDFHAFADRFRLFVEQTVGRGTWRVWVAELDRALVANVWLQMVQHVPRPDGPADPRPVGYVTNAFVAGAHRDRGLGSVMLEEMLGWARRHALQLVIVWPTDRSIPFYRRAGFEPSADAMTVRIRDDG